VTVSGYVEFETLCPVSVRATGRAVYRTHGSPRAQPNLNKLQRKSSHTARLYDYVNCS
jgi:hypothetical protein